MAIKVGKKKARIGAGVMDYYQVAAENAMRGMYEKIHSSPSFIAKELVQKKRGDIARLNAILTTPEGPGKGLDLELTRLRGIDFESIDIAEIDGLTWFAAHTKHLRIQTVQGRTYKDRYAHSDKTKLGEFHDLGDYKVYVRVADLATPKIKNIHFVPDREPFSPDRHYHHRAYGGEKKHPVLMSPNTCWGGFAEPVSACMEACDLPDLFRILRIFVGRRNPQSLLVRTISFEEFHDE